MSSPPPLRWLLVLVVPLVFAAVVPRVDAGAQTRPSSAPVIREGLDHLLSLYVDPLEPDQLLSEAWNGAVAAAIAAGVDDIPALGVLPAERDAAWDAFLLAFTLLERVAAGRISSQELAHAALEAMLDGRHECHSYFLNPEQYARFRQSLEGREQFAGIGVQIQQGPPFVIVTVFPGSPAEQAGLQPGDEIAAVDGMPARELSQSALSALVRGPVGTAVTLTIVRDGETFDLTLTRALISVPLLTHTLRPDGVGVITLNNFAVTGASERQLRAALRDLEARGAKAWVLDLRANPGGSPFSMASVLGAFVSRGTLAVTIETRSGPPERLGVQGELITPQRPLAVLVGPATGSAAELATAVLQDTGRARIFGQQTAGCANLGTIRALSDGAGMVVTSGRVYAGPRQRPIDGYGVTPDEITTTGPGDPTLLTAVAYLLSRIPAQAGAAP